MDYFGTFHLIKNIKTAIITTMTSPFVTTEVKNPTSEPKPVFTACLTPDRDTTSSAMTAPKNGPTKIPATGMTKGPIRSPIVLPHIPALEPPNFFTPTRLDNVSAPNSKITNNT